MGALQELPEHLDELKNQLMHFHVVCGNDSVALTDYLVYVFLVIAILLIVVLIVGRKLKFIPNNKFVNMVEYGYVLVTKDIAKGNVGHGYKKHVPFLASLFFFILIANFVGLIPGAKAATGSISITLALAICSFVYFNYWGIKAKGGWGYIKSIVPAGLPIVMVPVIWFFETLSLFLRALTLAFRLYGNMFAGHMVLGIFAVLTSIFTTYAISSADFFSGLPAIAWLLFLIAMYCLECMVAFLQAYVFTTLSAVYISLAISEH